MRNLAIFAALSLSLGACASVTNSQWATDVGEIQVAVPIAEAAIAVSGYGTNAAVMKAEAALNTDVAALSNTVAPATAALVLSDAQVLVAALPLTTLSAAHQEEITALIAVAKALAAATS